MYQYLEAARQKDADVCSQQVAQLRTGLRTALAARSALRVERERLAQQEQVIERDIQHHVDQLQKAEDQRAHGGSWDVPITHSVGTVK